MVVSVAEAQNQPKAPPKDFEQDESDYQLRRQEWFYGQRAYPHKAIPPGARRKAWLRFQERLAAEAAARSRGNASDLGSWQLIGPATMNGYWGANSGRVTAVAVDPTNNQIVYAGAAQGGVWKTTNGGNTWTPLTDTQASLAIGSIAIDPQNHLTIYVGTGEENNSGDSYYGEGILKSVDGGNTWTNIPGPFAGGSGGGARIGGLAVQPNNSSVVLAAVGCCAPGPSGVYRSADGGNTWTQELNQNYSNAYNVIFDPNSPNIAYASVDAHGVYRSTDGGLTWNPVNGAGAGALPLSGNGRVAIAMDPNTTTTLWAAIASNTNNNLAGLFKTTNSGNSWTKLPATPNFCSGQCWYDLALAIQPGNSSVIFAGGAQISSGSVVQSIDGGHTWTTYTNIHPDAHAFTFTPDGTILYVGNDGGMWSTNQPTSTSIVWNNLNTGLATEQFYPGLSIDSNNINIGFGGTQDNGTESYNGSTTWNVVACGDGGVTLIDNSTNPDTVYTNCIEVSFWKSTDGGQTFQSKVSGINTSDSVGWTPPAAIDPTNPQRLYFGTDYVYQTTNGADQWAKISPPLTGYYLTAIAVSPVNPDVVWTGSEDSRISLSQNATSGASSTWTDVTGTGMLPNRYITAIAADPQQAGTAYATFSGFSGYGDNLGHVFMTTNAGGSWTDISSNLPNIPANDIVVDPLQANTIYVATDFGVFYTTNGGAAWATLVTGLPRVAVLSLKLHPSRNLIAATHGRSMWETNVSSITQVPSIVSLSPPSVPAGSSTFTLTVNGAAFTPTAIVQWNGSDLQTTYVSATQLTATVPASDVTQSGTAQITVMIPGGSVSNQFAFQIQASYSLTVNEVGQGTVTSTDGQINCVSGVGSCSAPYATSASVTLNAAPASGWTFSGWSNGPGTCSGANPCNLVMNQSLNPTATFTQNTSTFTLTVTEAGQGTVTSTDGQINCTTGSGTCSANYTSGAQVTLNAAAASQWTFSGWSSNPSGSYCNGQNPCSFTMSQSETATATFLQYNLLLASPKPGITLSGSMANFSWSAVSGVSQYLLAAGTAPNGTDIFQGTTSGTSQSVNFIPCTGGAVYVSLKGDVNGQWQPASNYTYSCKPAIGDFNGDGHQDLVWQNTSTGQVNVNYFGSAGPQPQGSAVLNNGAALAGWKVVGAADFDGNGVPDLVYQNTATGQVNVNYFGGANGTQFIGYAVLNSGAGTAGWSVVAIADMNGDGIPDLIWQNSGTHQVNVNYYGGLGGATLTGFAVLNSGAGTAGWRVAAAADFDQNGTPDLVWQNQNTGQVNVNYYGGGSGATFIGWAELNSGAGTSGWAVVGATDMNADGIPDLIWENAATGQVNVNYYGSGGGAAFKGWNCLNCGSNFAGMSLRAVAPFGSSGEPALVWQNNNTNMVTVYYYAFGGSVLQGWNVLNYGAGTSGWHLVGAADLDGNGVPDLVWQNSSTGQVNVNYYGGAGGATLIGWAMLNSGAGTAGWSVVAVADMNGDGYPDLIWQNSNTGQVNVNYYGGQRGATFVGWAELNSGAGTSGWHVVAAADFDGNGVPDLVWQNTSTRQVNVNYYGGANGSSFIGWAVLNPGMSGWTVVGASDFDGNGVPDLVWRNDSTGGANVYYYGGARGAVMKGWNVLSSANNSAWRLIVPR